MLENNPRSILDALIRERGEHYASLSRLIGRNAAYVQQFIKRGVPKKLDEEDRHTLARYFGIAEERLGGPKAAVRKILPAGVTAHRGEARLVAVPRFEVRASAGAGALDSEENSYGGIAFDARWLRELAGSPSGLSVIRVAGDSMAPTLSDGDEIMVDSGDAADRLRDGIYVLRLDDTLMVKRLVRNPLAREITIQSDNPTYPNWPCDPAKIEVIGRVIWAGRRVD